ncbi:sigma-70 family RNA polymerase sigma factor [soil metagenome]
MDDTPADAALVEAAQAGSAASLGTLLERHRASMLAVAIGQLGYGPEAQDAVQDAMLIALQRLTDIRDPGAAGAWLRAIVRNVCRMRRRASREHSGDDSVILGLASNDPVPEELLDRHALGDWVWQALEGLSEPLQLVILLRYFSGLSSYAQIAAVCGAPVGTVRSRLHQARSKLGASLLATADIAHSEATVLQTRRQREAAELLASAEHGAFGAALAASWCADVSLVGPQGQHVKGWSFLVRAMEADLEAGVRQRLAQVTASRHITIMECELLSPPWDPEHCPAGVAWLLFLRDNRVERARLVHPPPQSLPQT